MFTKLAKLLSPTLRKKEGFTLIELLIVVAIIAILAAIAIPQFSAYRRRGYNAAANSDLRNIRTTEEAMFADFQDYGASHDGSGTITQDNTGVVVGSATTSAILGLSSARTTTTPQTVSLSRGVMVIVQVLETGGSNTTHIAKATHAAGDQVYGADSDVASLYRTNCQAAGACTSTTDLGQAPTAAATGNQYTGVGNWIQM